MDENHGVESYKKMEERNVIPSDIEAEDRKLLQYIVEEHPRDFEKAKKRLNELNIHDKQRAADLLSILKDADTLDRCRFGNVDILYLINPESKKLVNLGYQLLTIYPEILN